MSYSFSVTADSKDAAGQMVEEQLGIVVQSQPAHQYDRQAAQDAAEAFINLLGEPGEGECVYVSVSGWLSWRRENDFTGANVSVSASIVNKVA